MGMIRLPSGRRHGRIAERSALRQGIASRPAQVRVIKRLPEVEARPTYCCTCAGPIDFGAVYQGIRVYCSVECSLGGDRPQAKPRRLVFAWHGSR